MSARREARERADRREALVDDVFTLFALTLCVVGLAFGLGALFSGGLP